MKHYRVFVKIRKPDGRKQTKTFDCYANNKEKAEGMAWDHYLEEGRLTFKTVIVKEES